MSSSFLEVTISPKNEKKQKIAFNILFYSKIVVIIGAIGCLIDAFFVNNLFWFPLAFFIFAIFVLPVFQRKTYCFYDYSFVLGSVRINVIINNKRSKPFVNFDCNKILKAGNIESDFFLSNLSTKKYKIYKATPNEIDEYSTVFLVQGLKEVRIVILEFNEKFLSKILSCSSLQNYDKNYLQLITNK
ncbi:MAG: hypothetical protein J6R29_01290 [Clostridia bacterium]|nr:hypothetical protein [Clostridia bacterium]